MRVLFWSAAFWPRIGGVQQFGGRLLRALQHRGHEFVVVAEQYAPDLPLEDDFNGIRVVRLGLSWRRPRGVEPVAETRRRVIELKRSFRPELVHTNAVSDSDFFHHTTARVSPSPWLVTLHGQWPVARRSLVRRTLLSATWVTGCSEAILERGRQLAPEIRGRSSVIYNALEEPPVSPNPLVFDPPRLLYLGRLSPEKRVDLVLEAVATLLSDHPSVQLTVAGDGPERERLERQTAQLGLGNHVEFRGWVAQSDVPALIDSATLVLLASEQEAFGLTALEAAFMARPVVAPYCGGLPEIIEHGRTGILVHEPDATTLAEVVDWLLRHPESAARMGRAARIRARTVFNWEDCLDAYEALYDKLLTMSQQQAS
jgi:glycosyltransferase involved in cell wall biosynthesis